MSDYDFPHLEMKKEDFHTSEIMLKEQFSENEEGHEETEFQPCPII